MRLVGPRDMTSACASGATLQSEKVTSSSEPAPVSAITVTAVAAGSAAGGKLKIGDRLLQIDSTPVDPSMTSGGG